MSERAGPPRHVMLMGWTLSRLVAHLPAAWPLLRPATQRFWDRMAAGWAQRGGSPGRLDALEAACERVGPDLSRIVDLGTGTGTGAILLARRFPQATVTGVDLSAEMVAIAGRDLPADVHGRVTFVAADAAALPFEPGTIDVVAQLNVPVYFEEIARVLAPGGAVIVASSFGPATPYFTPERTLRRRFAKRGFSSFETGAAGPGTYFVARAPAD